MWKEAWADRRDLPWMTIGLTAINVLVFLWMEWNGSTQDAYYMYEHGALLPEAVTIDGEYYRLLTAAFLHFGAAHLMNNMLMLVLLGQRLEKAVGRIRYLLIYLFSAVGANVVSVWWYLRMQTYALSAGASGALMGAAGAMFAVILKRRGSQGGLGRRDMIILIVLSIYSGYAAGGANNMAHLSGLVFGFLAGWIAG